MCLCLIFCTSLLNRFWTCSLHMRWSHNSQDPGCRGRWRGCLVLGHSSSPGPVLHPMSRSGLLVLDPSPQSPDSPPPVPHQPISHLHCTFTGVISNWTDEHRIPPCTIFQAFKYYLDITTPPTPLQLQQFASLATSEKEKQRLLVLSKVGPWPGTTSMGAFHPFLRRVVWLFQQWSTRWQSCVGPAIF